jgi:hypothetical protein
MRHEALALLACALLGCACSATPVSPSCSDAAYRSQLMACSAAAVSCVSKGGTDAECGSVCDKEWADWQERCSQ